MFNNDTKKKEKKKDNSRWIYKKKILHNEICETTEYSCKATGRSSIFWVIEKKTPQ